jgi:FlaG/FlaF family flagellin (archaellin)
MNFFKDKRAVSPVIAVILLVGVAIGAAALAYSWYTGLQTGTQEASGEAAGRLTLSTSASMVIRNLQNDTDVTVTIANTGATSLSNFTMYIGTKSAQNTTVAIAKGDIQPMTFAGMGNNINTGVTLIKVISREGAVATYQYVA